MDETSLLLERLLLWVVVPLWMAMGFLDWACHRIQRIEHSAGLKESWLHLAMLGQLGLGMGAALAFQPTAALLAFLGMVCLAHEVTTWWDLRYAQSRRVIPTYEQWVHAWQLVIPWVAWAMLLLAHRHRVLALVGEGHSPADWHVALRDPFPPLRVWVALGTGAAVLVIGPFFEEHARCRAAARRR